MPKFIDVENIFMYHEPRLDQIPRYEAIRAAAKDFANVLIASTPVCADQNAAIRLLRESVMTANAAIALEPEPEATEADPEPVPAS